MDEMLPNVDTFLMKELQIITSRHCLKELFKLKCNIWVIHSHSCYSTPRCLSFLLGTQKKYLAEFSRLSFPYNTINIYFNSKRAL